MNESVIQITDTNFKEKVLQSETTFFYIFIQPGVYPIKLLYLY